MPVYTKGEKLPEFIAGDQLKNNNEVPSYFSMFKPKV